MSGVRLDLLILGGYGRFGGSVARLLADEGRLRLIVAGRSEARAVAFCRTLPGNAEKVPAVFDRNADVERQLRILAPAMVVDASGPFQSYGDDPYRLVRACLALGIDYLDLADSTAFVMGIAKLDAAARGRDRFALSGVSTFPVLSTAVTRELSRGLARVDSVVIGLAPSPFAGLGLSVVRAVAGYAGKPVSVVRDGRHRTSYALTETVRYAICPPGRLPLRSTRFSLIDVPDLQLLPTLWPELRSAWVGAATAPAILHWGMTALAWLVRWGLLPSLVPLTGVFFFVANRLRWGEHRSGMFVSIAGAAHDNSSAEHSWHLLAEGDDGPLIPAMAVAALVLRLLAGRRPRAGARASTDDLELADYTPFFSRRAIHTGIWRETSGSSGPLYRRMLGAAWDELPRPLRAMHDVTGKRQARGAAFIERGRGLLSRAVGSLFGFPKQGRDVPLAVLFEARGGGEIWRRDFAGRVLSSIQHPGYGRHAHLVWERFGPVSVALALVSEERRLQLIVRAWRFLGVPLPLALGPRGSAVEYAEGDRFCFDVDIGHAFIGRIVRYHGWLLPVD